jgi:hypothetical protein
MTKTYFGFAVADGMFVGEAIISRAPITAETAKQIIQLAGENFCPALNPSHGPTIEAAKKRFDLDVKVPETAPIIKMEKGDRLVVMSVRGLPRMEGRHEYTNAEIEGAHFEFSLWERVS